MSVPYLLTRVRLEDYLRHDCIGDLLEKTRVEGIEAFTCERWLRDSAAKRLMYWELYGELLQYGAPRLRILDVGGGFCALSKILIEKHEYTLVEINAHDDGEQLRRMERQLGREFLAETDWYDLDANGGWDIVIANDLFPNVDQRLPLFLDKFIRACGEIRLSLTYHERSRFYFARRLNADEIICVLAWNGMQTWAAIEPYLSAEQRASGLPSAEESIFENGRQVLMARLNGRGGGT
ncbi:MAG TPA: class I SAM-dependent methyltransferase [Xanthobacteraceae bacterium]|nr:class I SAM-dependent methyltransferase [Xanthobacteraceae bacterium]